MKREITVPTLGGIYKFTANSPDDEEIIRKVAKAVNGKAEVLQKMYPGKSEAEISRMIALNEGIRAARAQKIIEDIGEETGILQKELESYLDNIEKI